MLIEDKKEIKFQKHFSKTFQKRYFLVESCGKMGFVESSIDFGVKKSGEFVERAVMNSAKVGLVAGVFGIGTTAASLGIMVAEHAPEIIRASKRAADIAGKLVR